MASMKRTIVAAAFALGLSGSACAPKVKPLKGAPLAVPFPVVELPEGHRQLTFQWEYTEPEMVIRGEGVARSASPDSVRLDLFLGGGFGGGRAFLIGDTLDVPGGDLIRRYLPPAPLLWAALGRLRVPGAADTTARVDGKTIRADIGRNPQWRASIIDGRLARLERIDDGRLREWVERRQSGTIVYRHETSQRALTIRITRTQDSAPFDEALWSR
jgi:hypothetical protein